MPAPSPRLEDFLRLLADRGMLRGVDRRLRIELALRELGEPADRRELHDLLVPLVARNREEQARFRELFDDFFGVGPTVTRRSSSGIALPASPTTGGPPKPWRPRIAGVAMVVLVALALIWRGEIRDWLRGPQETPTADTSAVNDGGRPPIARPDTAPNRLDTLLDADPGLRAVPIDREESGVPGRIVGASFGTAALIGLPMLLAAFASRRRRALAYAADDARKRTPPLVYTPKPPKPALFMSAEFFDAVRVAVRRQRMDGNRISVERTVAATIAAGGLPTLRFEPASRPPEYLILIERASAGDHQALLFDAMAQRMRQEGMLYVERYFYERDPRLCRSEQRGPTTIDELQRRFHEHRLVVFGDGDGLFDALSEAELAPWTSVFEAWQDRAILTARPVAAWGARERALGELFVMLPATPQGLREIVESFERGTSPDLRPWREGEVDRRWTRRGQADVQTLRASLDKRVWRWVCACAVYPNLHWALTLYLATLPELGGGELLREEHLLRVVALPWFRDGFMPPEVRAELVDELDEDTERAIRRTLARLLELDAPDATTAAGRWHEAQMFVQAVLANPDDGEVRAALEARVRALPKALLLRDPAAARRLREVHHKRLDRLPRAARSILYRDGISLFGPRPWTRRSAGAATVLAVAVLPSFLWTRREPPPAVASFIAPLRIRLPLGREFTPNAIALDATGKAVGSVVTWAVVDSQVAAVSPLRGQRAGTTELIVSAGGSFARIPVDIVPAESAGAPIVITMPAKSIRVGELRALPHAPAWKLSCDASVATAIYDRAFQGQAVGAARIVAALDSSEDVELRDLLVEPNPTDTVARLTAPINFERGSSQLTSAARTALESKVARLRANPTLRLSVAIREMDAFATRAPLTSRRFSAITEFFASAGIATDRVVVASETLDYQSQDRFCATPVTSHATFTPTVDPYIADATTRPNRSGAVAMSAAPPLSRRPVNPTVTPRLPVTRPNVRSPAVNAPSDAAQTNLAVVGYGSAATRAVPGDTGEAREAMKARLDLRGERRLSPASGKADANGDEPGTYGFIAPPELISAITSRSARLAVNVRRTDSFDFEIHNVGGVRYIAGFVRPQIASSIQRTFFSSPPRLEILPSAAGAATCPIEIPLSSVSASTFVSAPTPALQITIEPRTKDEPYVPRGVTGCRPPAAAN